MNEQNRLRLDRIAARHAKRTAQGRSEADSETDTAFLAAFDRVRDEVLRPVMAEVGVQLEEAGYGFRITPGGAEESPAVELHVRIADRGDSKDIIRFLALKDAGRGWQVIGELDLKGSPVELTRFATIDEITHDVVEQLLVDAVEQMFASVGAPPKGESADLSPDEIVGEKMGDGPAALPAAPAPPASSVDSVLSKRPDLAFPSTVATAPLARRESLPMAPAGLPLVNRPPAALSGTSMGFVAPTGPALPFAPGAATDPSSPAASTPTVKRAPALFSGTSMPTFAPAGPAMPFASAHASRDTDPRGADLRGTLAARAAGTAAVLPFDPTAQAILPAPAGPRPARSSPDLSGTLDATVVPAGAVVPFSAAPVAPPPEALSLERYASLCVELAAEPARVADVLRRYRIVPAQHKVLDDYWQRRMAADTSVWTAFNRACASYQEWLRTHPLKLT